MTSDNTSKLELLITGAHIPVIGGAVAAAMGAIDTRSFLAGYAVYATIILINRVRIQVHNLFFVCDTPKWTREYIFRVEAPQEDAP